MRIPGAGRVARIVRHATAAVRRRSPRGVILLYHRIAGPRLDPLLLDVSVANFDAHLAMLRADATVLALDEFEALRRGGRLPARAVAVTFDDGYADNLHAAAPVLAARGVPATVFVTSGMVGATSEFWWDDIERIALGASKLAGQPPLEGAAWPMVDASGRASAGWNAEMPGDPSPRHALYRRLVDAVRPMAPQARDAGVARLRTWAGVEASARPSHRTLTADELRSLATLPGVTIGAHSVTHPVLALLPLEEQRRELTQCRARLAEITGRTPTTVAYPFGTHGDVSGDTERAAEDAGFATGYANEPACAWRWSRRYRVPRILVRDWTGDELARRLSSWWTT